MGEGRERRDPGWSATGRTRTDDRESDWWAASEVYTRSPPTANPSSRSGGERMAMIFQLAPWLVVHLVLLGSAVATGWFTYTRAERLMPNALPAAVVGVLLIGLVVTLSALHLVSILYT